MTPLPIVTWRRADGVPTLAHEAVGDSRTRCGCHIPFRKSARVRRSEGVVTCPKCQHFRAVDEGRAKTWRPSPVRITKEVVTRAREAFLAAGGVIQRIGAR